MLSSGIASLIGSSEASVRLLLSLFLGYPLAFLYRWKPVYNLGSNEKHVLFTVIGLFISYYNFGWTFIHPLLNVSIIYLVLAVFGPNKFTVIFTFVFNNCYLIAGYVFQEAQEFGVSWTMPHCVLTLRLTAVAFDYYDGQKSRIPDDQKETALNKLPSYIEMLGHTFFFGGYLIGPQFSMRRYQQFTSGGFSKSDGTPPNNIRQGLQRGLTGIVYIVVFQVTAVLIPDSYMYSNSFNNHCFLFRCLILVLWGRNSINKYIGAWLVVEGSIILTGLGYNGKDNNGNELWDGCSNVKVWALETGESFTDFIRSFNVNTNRWMAKYIFKRLKFLGNKLVSQFLALLYLALWHGLRSGYYVCFILELIQTNAEQQLIKTYEKRFGHVRLPDSPVVRLLLRAVRKLILLFCWSYALASFILLDWDKWLHVYKSVWFIGHLAPLFIACFCHLINTHMSGRRPVNGPKGDASTGHTQLKKEM